jgi:uncharacterized membrane protein
MGDNNALIFYIIAFVVMVAGFIMVFMTHSTTILAAGAILIIIGLFVFVFGREQAKKARA